MTYSQVYLLIGSIALVTLNRDKPGVLAGFAVFWTIPSLIVK
jgi:hypothetical protein